MRKISKTLLTVVFAIILASPISARAQAPPPPLQLDAAAVILMEASTGRVLYGRNESVQIYPASMTKMLTAIVALEYLSPDDIVVVGEEIRGMPSGFATHIHLEGETITVRILLKAMLIPSGNESARVLAINTIRARENRQNILYNEAKQSFAALMNNRARSLGAVNTKFNNPFGLHSESHFTTAHDLALIARAFMEVPLLAEIVGMRTFSGNSLEGRSHPNALTRDYNWTNTNLTLPGQAHGHAHMTGLRTGFTNQAGHSLVGSAYNNGLELITVVSNSEDPGRWQDTRRLMDFGFNNFAFREISYAGQLLGNVRIENPRLGDSDTLYVMVSEGYTALLGHWEYAGITKVITYDPLLLVEQGGDSTATEDYQALPMLRAPIEDGAAVGTVQFLSGSELIFEASIIAGREVPERTFDSDMDYYISMILDNIFTRRALPYWFGFVGMLTGILGVTMAITVSRRAKRLDRWQQPTRPRVSKYERR